MDELGGLRETRHVLIPDEVENRRIDEGLIGLHSHEFVFSGDSNQRTGIARIYMNS